MIIYIEIPHTDCTYSLDSSTYTDLAVFFFFRFNFFLLETCCSKFVESNVKETKHELAAAQVEERQNDKLIVCCNCSPFYLLLLFIVVATVPLFKFFFLFILLCVV